MSAPLQIAIIGFGRMGQLYAETIRHVDGVQLYAIADPFIHTLTDEVAGYDVAHVTPDVKDAITLVDVHAVIIAAPTNEHPALVATAAEAGKAIFCEKPLALSLEDSQKMVAAVEAAGVPLQVGFMRRFDAGYVRAKEMIDAGEIGDPILFKSISRDPVCPRTNYADPTKSGGFIIDMGIHDFDLARWLTDSEVERVSAEGSLLVCDNLREVGDIDQAVVNLRFETGAVGNVDMSRTTTYGYDIRTEVLGTKGAVRVGYERETPAVLLTGAGVQHDFVPSMMDRFEPAYYAQIRHFVECLQNGREPAVTGADAHAAFEISLAATRSEETGQPMAISDL